MNPYLFLIFFFAVFNLKAQTFTYDKTKISKETNRIIEKIENVNIVMGSAVSVSGYKPEQYENYEELKTISNKIELQELTRHPNSVVRSYAFQALTKHKELDFYPIILEHLNDYEIIETFFGCLVDNQMVGDYFLQQVIFQEYQNLNWENDSLWDESIVISDKKISLLTDNQLKKVDSLVLFGNNKLEYRNVLIEELEISERNYPIVRNIYLNENNQHALINLSKHKNKQDINLIIQNENSDSTFRGNSTTYYAILNFPDEAFLPFLEKELNTFFQDFSYGSYEIRALYSAIAQFKNEKSVQLLNSIYSRIKQEKQITKRPESLQFYFEDFYTIFHENYDPIYNDLLFELWEKNDLINQDIFGKLVKYNSKRSYELTKKYLLDSPEISKINFTPMFSDDILEGYLENSMSKFILLNEKDLAFEIIKSKIEDPKENPNQYVNIVNDLMDKSFIPSLFKRLEKEWNAHLYLPIVETLISFKDDSINQRIIEVRKVNRKLNESWGGKEIDKILKENSIQ